jgi:hypothetical protein
MHITLLDRDTELAETVLARPPRVLGWLMAVAALLVAGAATWAYVTPVDTVVRADVRVRPST